MTSSLEATDNASKDVQKTPNRISLAELKAKILQIEYLHPGTIPHMTICVITLTNGFSVVDHSCPADPENFNKELGQEFAYDGAMRKLWPLEAYLLRERLSSE